MLKGADFVTLAFANEGVKLRGVDADISTKHGMTMCSADTIGPGGTMRTLREVPRQTQILKDVAQYCPDAWVINWVNPTAAMGIAMMRHFPQLKSLAICDGPHNPHFDNQLMIDAGLAKSAEAITDALRSRVKIRSGGVNHFNWLVEMRYKDKDVTGKVKDKLQGCHPRTARCIQHQRQGGLWPTRLPGNWLIRWGMCRSAFGTRWSTCRIFKGTTSTSVRR